MTTDSTVQDLASLHEWYWRRFLSRLSGLTDDEYFWEPVPGCWSVRRRSDGTSVADFADPAPSPTPITTIAWRMTHLGARPADPAGGMSASGASPGEFVRNYWASNSPVGSSAAGGADEAIDLLAAHYESQHASLVTWSDEDLHRPLIDYGLQDNPYSESSLLGLFLHSVDEQIHHMAEVALLRDLFQAGFRS